MWKYDRAHNQVCVHLKCKWRGGAWTNYGVTCLTFCVHFFLFFLFLFLFVGGSNSDFFSGRNFVYDFSSFTFLLKNSIFSARLGRYPLWGLFSFLLLLFNTCFSLFSVF